MGKENTLKQLLRQATTEELQQELKDRGIRTAVKGIAFSDVLKGIFTATATIFILLLCLFVVCSAFKMGLFSAVLSW